MNIFVMPRWEAETFQCERPFAIITISDPGKPGVQRHEVPKLHLEFKDYKQRFDTFVAENRFVMQDEQARQVWDFVAKLPPFFNDLVISCEVGASRSPSMAMAICDGLGISRKGSIIGLEDKRLEIVPNQHVYETTLRAK